MNAEQVLRWEDLATRNSLASKESLKSRPNLSRFSALPRLQRACSGALCLMCISHHCASPFGEAEEPLVPPPDFLLSLLLTQHLVSLVSEAAMANHLKGEPEFIGLVLLPILPLAKGTPRGMAFFSSRGGGAAPPHVTDTREEPTRGESLLESAREWMIAELCFPAAYRIVSPLSCSGVSGFCC